MNGDDQNHEQSQSIEGPPPKQRKLAPLLIKPQPLGKDIDFRSSIDFSARTRTQLSKMAAAHFAEVDAWSHRVENGLCWQESYAKYPPLESGPITYSTKLPQHALDLLTWTGDQKATFIELLGRKSAAALPLIAKQVGKSEIECATYYELLKEGSKAVSVDSAEIPAAEEVQLEPWETLEIEERLGKRGKYRKCLFELKSLERDYGIIVSPAAQKVFTNSLRAVLKTWIKLAVGKAHRAQLRPMSKEILHIVLSDKNAMTRKIEELDPQIVNASSSEQQPQPAEIDEKEEDQEEEILQNESLKETEKSLWKLESAWLDSLDVYNAKLSLAQRGLLRQNPAEVIPPPPRSQDLEKYMQSRRP